MPTLRLLGGKVTDMTEQATNRRSEAVEEEALSPALAPNTGDWWGWWSAVGCVQISLFWGRSERPALVLYRLSGAKGEYTKPRTDPFTTC